MREQRTACHVLIVATALAANLAATPPPPVPITQHGLKLLHEIEAVAMLSNGDLVFLSPAGVSSCNVAAQRCSLVNRSRMTRTGFALTRLADDRILVVGGERVRHGRRSALATAAIYDPATDTWRAAAKLHEARVAPAITVLPDGRVRVSGGVTEPDAEDEVYDPRRDTWTLEARVVASKPSAPPISARAAKGAPSVFGVPGTTRVIGHLGASQVIAITDPPGARARHALMTYEPGQAMWFRDDAATVAIDNAIRSDQTRVYQPGDDRLVFVEGLQAVVIDR